MRLHAQLKTVTPLHPHSHITWGVELVTPADAARYLLLNINNRPKRRNLTAKYASEMRSGHWGVNGQDIIFDENGNMIDGQHRCEGVIEAGVPVYMGVKRGVPASNFVTLDSGASRTAADVVSIAGIQYASVVTSAARLVLLYSMGLDLNTAIARTEISRFCIGNPELERAATQAKAASKKSQVNAGPLAAVIYLANRKGKLIPQMDEFLEGVTTGAHLRSSDPRLTLRNWAVRSRDKTGHALTGRINVAAIARCWTAFANGQDLATIYTPKGFTSAFIRIAGYEPF
jgi:hypothetical protein